MSSSFDYLRYAILKLTPYLLKLVLTSSALSISALYGNWALRCFVGEDMATLILGGNNPLEWRWLAYVNLPLIPWTLIFSRTKILRSVIHLAPFLMLPSHPAPSHIPISATRNLFSISEDSITPHYFSYPPSPPVLFALMPFFQWGYHKAYRATARWLLAKPTHTKETRAQRRRVVVLHNGGAPPDDQAIRNALDEHHQQAPPHEGEEEADPNDEVEQDLVAALDRGEQVSISGTTLCRLFLGSLMLPPISKVMGHLLLEASHIFPILKPFLGVRSGFASSGIGLSIGSLGLRFGSRRIDYTDYNNIDPVWYVRY